MLILAVLVWPGCQKREPEGVIKTLIEQGRDFNNHLYYWETLDGKTAIYRIAETTSDINCIVYDLEGVRDVKSSRDAVYILHDDNTGHLAVSRLEGNRAMVTEAVLDVELTASAEKPWAVSAAADRIFVVGADESDRFHIVEVDFERTEAERTFKENEVLVPTVSYEQNEWYVTDEPIGMIDVSDEAEVIAMTMPSGTGSEPTLLYFLTGPGKDPVLVDEKTVVEFGGFSSDSKTFLATMELSRRVDLYMIKTDSLESKPITRVATDFRVEHPAWHPNGKYVIYSTDYTSEFRSESTPLSGDQLFLYSLVSDNDRRLTAFQGQSLWVDFSPNGDFLMYASSPGVAVRSGRGIPDKPEQQSEQQKKQDSELETWRLSYVPWNEDDFVTGNIRVLNSDEVDFIVSWTVGGNLDIEFTWGPEMSGL